MGYIRVNGLNRHRSRCWNATVCAVELGFGLSQLLGGDSWGGLQGEGLRRSGWRWTPHLGAHRWTPPLVGRPRCWRTRCGVSFRESELRWSAGRLGFPRDADLSWVTVHPQSHRFPAGGVALPTGAGCATSSLEVTPCTSWTSFSIPMNRWVKRVATHPCSKQNSRFFSLLY